MYRVVVIIGLCFTLFQAFGQEPETFADFNNRTYALYKRKQWKELLETGRKALKKGYDFYYLRMRMGIAAYEKQNYVHAIHHFRKALIFSKNDPVALEYLYYAYLFAGRDIEAGRLTQQMPVALLKETGYNNEKNLTGLDFLSSYFSGSGTLVVQENTSTVIPGDGWRNMDVNGGEASVMAEWNAGKNSRIHTGYRFLTKQRNAYILDNGQATYYSPNIYNQHFFYADIRTRIFRDTYLKLSAGYLNLRPRYAARSRWGFSYIEVFPEHNFTGDLSFHHDLEYLSLAAGAGVSGLNGYLQFRQDAEMIFYPSGNRDLYFSASVTNVVQQATAPAFSHSFFGSAALGVRIAKPVWLELYGSAGDRYNVLMPDGWHIYNEFNPVSSVFGGDVLISFPEKNLVITAGYYQSAVTSWYFYKYQEILYRNEPIQYNLLNIYGGLKWKF